MTDEHTDARCCICKDRAAVDGDYCVPCGRLMGRAMRLDDVWDEEDYGPDEWWRDHPEEDDD